MEVTKTVPKCLTIRRDQEEFLIAENGFNLSKFVRAKLDDYIRILTEYREFVNDVEIGSEHGIEIDMKNDIENEIEKGVNDDGKKTIN